MDLTATLNRRKLVFAALYLCEGGPIGFIWWALPTRLREAGVAVEDITALTSVVVLPWLLKFLWAPAVDVARSARWGHRHWIVSCQALMGLTLLPVAFLDFTADLALLYVLLPIHAVAIHGSHRHAPGRNSIQRLHGRHRLRVMGGVHDGPPGAAAGYPFAFGVMAAASLPALPLLALTSMAGIRGAPAQAKLGSPAAIERE